VYRGRKLKWDRTEFRAAISLIPMVSRTTFSNMGKAINIPRTTLYHMMHKEYLFCRHTSALQPHHTDKLKIAHFYFAMDKVYPVPNPNGEYKFKDMPDRVDVDEKWFYLTKKSDSYILISAKDDNDKGGESHVYRAPVKNRSHIKMVMFLCAQARPRWDNNACKSNASVGW
jgi:hypothetical protein